MTDERKGFGQAGRDDPWGKQQPQGLEDEPEETERLMDDLEQQRQLEEELRERLRQAGEKER